MKRKLAEVERIHAHPSEKSKLSCGICNAKGYSWELKCTRPAFTPEARLVAIILNCWFLTLFIRILLFSSRSFLLLFCSSFEPEAVKTPEDVLPPVEIKESSWLSESRFAFLPFVVNVIVITHTEKGIYFDSSL